MKVGTPFGEYPFVYRRVERRDGEVAVIGTVAGVESSVVFDRDDAVRVAKALAVVAAVAVSIRALGRRRGQDRKARAAGREGELRAELDQLFEAENRGADGTFIAATFLQVSAAV